MFIQIFICCIFIFIGTNNDTLITSFLIDIVACVFPIIAYTNHIIQSMHIPVLACYWYVCLSKINDPKFFCIGNL